MLALPLGVSPLTAGVFLSAADLCHAVRRSGLSVRTGTDCLIAACGLKHGLTVLHRDRDFDVLARVSHLSVRSVATTPG